MREHKDTVIAENNNRKGEIDHVSYKERGGVLFMCACMVIVSANLTSYVGVFTSSSSLLCQGQFWSIYSVKLYFSYGNHA